MSKISKTAKASMGAGPAVAKKVIADDELIRLLRIDRTSGIYPGVQGTDALLRAYDAALLQVTRLSNCFEEATKALNTATEQIEALRQLVPDALACLPPADGAYIIPPGGNGPDGAINDSTTFAVVQEPGLQPATQGLDSVETTLPVGDAQAS